MRVFVLITAYLFLISSSSNAQVDSLRVQINKIVKSAHADIGVSIAGLESKDTLTIHGSTHYPMQSVYKFHLALTVLQLVDNGSLKLDQNIFIKKSDLLPDTHSPMRDDHPEGNITLPLRGVLKYCVSISDNNACDILFRLIGGVNVANDYIHKLGIKEIAIAATEEEMHKEWSIQFANWTTPRAAILTLEKLYKDKILSPSSFNFLHQAMVDTPTGKNRIKTLLPEGTLVAHKTGSSGANDSGLIAAVNDLGIVTLPNGKHFVIAVFVSNTRESTDVCEKIIAEISLAAYKHFTR